MPLGPFIFDATFTLFKRLLRGEKFWHAHREHHYQLLVRSGWSHVRACLLQIVLMVGCSGAAFAYVKGSDWVRVGVLIAVAVGFTAYSVAVHRIFRAYQAAHRDPAPAEAKA